MYLLLALVFTAATLASGAAAASVRGEMCNPGVGYTVPARVENDRIFGRPRMGW